MERSQYEFFLKMFCYAHKRSEAVDFINSIPKSAKEFAKRAAFAWSYTKRNSSK